MKIYQLLLVLVLFVGACSNSNTERHEKDEKIRINLYDGDTLRTEVFQIDTGWGYRIYKNNRVFIEQNQIPAVAGFYLFTSAEKAQIAADFVADKMTKQQGLPSVTIEELDSIGVLDPYMLEFQRKIEEQWEQ